MRDRASSTRRSTGPLVGSTEKPRPTPSLNAPGGASSAALRARGRPTRRPSESVWQPGAGQGASKGRKEQAGHDQGDQGFDQREPARVGRSSAFDDIDMAVRPVDAGPQDTPPLLKRSTPPQLVPSGRNSDRGSASPVGQLPPAVEAEIDIARGWRQRSGRPASRRRAASKLAADRVGRCDARRCGRRAARTPRR